MAVNGGHPGTKKGPNWGHLIVLKTTIWKQLYLRITSPLHLQPEHPFTGVSGPSKKNLFGVPENTLKSPFIPKIWSFRICLLFAGIVGDLFSDPQKTLFEIFFCEFRARRGCRVTVDSCFWQGAQVATLHYINRFRILFELLTWALHYITCSQRPAFGTAILLASPGLHYMNCPRNNFKSMTGMGVKTYTTVAPRRLGLLTPK